MRARPAAVFFLVLISMSGIQCSSSEDAEQASTSKSAPASASAKPATVGKVKFKPYEVIDQKQGGLVVSRLAVPQDWKATSQVVWNYNNFYTPVHVSARIESHDGSSWIEFYPAEIFVWLDPAHDRAPIGPGGMGGIHHPNITLPEAMVSPCRRRDQARHFRPDVSVLHAGQTGDSEAARGLPQAARRTVHPAGISRQVSCAGMPAHQNRSARHAGKR